MPQPMAGWYPGAFAARGTSRVPENGQGAERPRDRHHRGKFVMPAAPSKSTAMPAAKADRATARDDRAGGRNAGIDTSMADPVEQLQRIAGNCAVSTLAALRNPGSAGGEPLPPQ